MQSTFVCDRPADPASWPVRAAAILLAACTAACGAGADSADRAPPPDPGGGAPPPGPPVTITVDALAVVTTSAINLYADPALRAQHLANVANDILASSGTGLSLEITTIATVDYPDGSDTPTALDDITFASHPAFSGIAAARDAAGADLVVLFRPYVNDGYCGYAWVGGAGDGANDPSEADFAYSVVSINCSDYVLLHEVGHNMGLVHSRRENPAGGSLHYGAGYGLDGVFVTVMASPSTFAAPQLPALSSASAQCLGFPCGVSYLDAVNGAEDARALRAVRGEVAAYR